MTEREQTLNWMTSKRLGGATEIAVMAPIRPGRVPGERRTYEERLRQRIASLQQRTEQGIPHELTRISTIHFGRMMVIRPEHFMAKSHPDHKPPEYREIGANDGMGAEPSDPVYHSWLLTIVNFDGDLKVYFRDIAEFLGEYFDRIFENCEDFPTVSRFEEFWQWIRRYQISADLFHSAYPDLTVPRIKHLQDFKRRFDEFVDQVRSPTGRKVDNLDDLFDQFLRETSQYSHDFPAAGGVYLAANRQEK